MSFACTTEPLRAANLLARRQLYEMVHFGTGDATESSGDAVVRTGLRLGATPPLDLLIVIAGGDPAGFADPGALAWLRRMARAGVRIGGVSGGPVILARAGIMEGRRMTVHWEHAAALAETHPGLLLEKRLYVIDRDRVTCGGGTAPLDLMHALIAGHHGPAFARLVSDWFLHTGIRAPADPQRAGLTERLGNHSPRVIAAVAAMENHVADPLTLPQLALVSGVSGRQLNRLFRDAFGAPVMTYYRHLRLDVAVRLVGGSAMPFAAIAHATGFANAGHFSQAYLERFGIRPSADRVRYR